MNIINAIKDKNLFRPFLVDKNGKLSSWKNWLACLRVLYGLPIKKQKTRTLLQEITGRTIFPADGFQTALLLVGRRGGKSRIAAVCAAFEAALSGKEKNLAPGELGLVSVVAPSRFQSKIVKSYIRAIFRTDLLEAEIVDESKSKDHFILSNGVRIQILTGDFRVVRGFTQLAVIIDEVCFMGLAEESKVRNDSELIQAIRPALLTTKGKLIAISTKYARKGWAHRIWKINFANDKGRVLCVDAPSIKMNPTLSQQDIDDAIAEDPIAGRTEFMNEWRDDVGAYLPGETIKKVVVAGRVELMARDKIKYFAFVDCSGGRSDDAAISIAHKKDSKVILDFIKRYKSPHSPYVIIESMCNELRRFNLNKVVGDNYSAQFIVDAFKNYGISYFKSKKVKSQLYLELLPRICSEEIELLDNELLINQLSSLERKTHSGGRDSVDHPAGGKDDVSNAVAGVCDVASQKVIVARGGFAKSNKRMFAY